MLTVTSLNGDIEPLNNYKDLEIEEEVNGAFTLSLTSFFSANNPGYDILEEESIVNVDGYDFRAKQFKEMRNRKEIVGPSTFFDLTGHRQEEIFGGTHTFDEFASFTFNGTGWTFINDGITSSALIPNFGNDNVVKLSEALCSTFECERKILPNNTVLFAKQIGPDNDAQYRYKHNIKTLSKSVDTTKLRTSIKGYGANGLVVTYTSPNASKFPHAGEADPIKDDRYTQADSMLERLKRELIDYPETALELDVAELIDKELGERVWLIYEPLNIEFQTRILSKRTIYRNGKLVPKSVVLGNRKLITQTDILAQQKVDIDENKKEYRSKFEQTNDRITLEVEAVNESIAAVNIRADNIVLSVEELGDSVAAINLRANSIEFSVSDLGDRVDSAEASINIQAGLISSKVEKDGVISAINQSAESIDIIASKINLSGITHVADTLTIGDGTDTFSSIRFNGSDSLIHSSSSGLMIDTIGVTFASSSVDFGGANIYNLKGYTKNYTGQSLQLWRSADGTKIRVYQDGYYSEFSASAQG